MNTDHLDLKADKIEYRRSKTGVYAEFPMWPETRRMLQEHCKQHADDIRKRKGRLFVTRQGRPLVHLTEAGNRSDAVQQRWNRLRDNAGVKGSFKLLRKTASQYVRNAASACPPVTRAAGMSRPTIRPSNRPSKPWGKGGRLARRTAPLPRQSRLDARDPPTILPASGRGIIPVHVDNGTDKQRYGLQLSIDTTLWKPEYSTVAAERQARFRYTRVRCDLHVVSLATDIIEAVLRGNEPDSLRLEKLRKNLPVR